MMKILTLMAAILLGVTAGTAIYYGFMTGSVSAQFPDPCGPPLYPTGCHRYDSVTNTCGNSSCGTGFKIETGAVLSGDGNQASVSKTVACTGGDNCPDECGMTSVASTSDCSTPAPTPTPPPPTPCPVDADCAHYDFAEGHNHPLCSGPVDHCTYLITGCPPFEFNWERIRYD
jgi:hypothetical protein